MIDREQHDWGVELTVHPFAGQGDLGSLFIRAQIGNYRPNRGCETKVTFSGVITMTPLSLAQAQTWTSAMQVLTQEAWKIVSQLKERAKQANEKPKKKAKKS